jgi:hypothetical protein
MRDPHTLSTLARIGGIGPAKPDISSSDTDRTTGRLDWERRDDVAKGKGSNIIFLFYPRDHGGDTGDH